MKEPINGCSKVWRAFAIITCEELSLRASSKLVTFAKPRKSLKVLSEYDFERVGMKPGDCGMARLNGTLPLDPPNA